MELASRREDEKETIMELARLLKLEPPTLVSCQRGASSKLFHNAKCYRDLLPIERYMCSLVPGQ